MLDNVNKLSKVIVVGTIAIVATRYLVKLIQSYNNNPVLKESHIRVEKIIIYPIKSCRGFEITTTELNKYGLVNDRRFMLCHEGRFISARNTPKMSTIVATISQDGKNLIVNAPDAAELVVPLNQTGNTIKAKIWSDDVDVVDCGDEAAKYFTDYLGKDLRLVEIPNNPNEYKRVIGEEFLQNLENDKNPYEVNLSDASQVMILSQASIDFLNQKIREERVARNENPQPDYTWERFRPNILVSGTKAFEEDQWKSFQIGNNKINQFNAIDHAPRCKLTTVEPETGKMDPYGDDEPFRTLKKYRLVQSRFNSPLFGLYAINKSNKGELNIGDQIHIFNDKFESKNHVYPQ